MLSAEVAALAREIAGEGTGQELLDVAARIAEAQVDLVRVRRARYELLSRALEDPNYLPPVVAKKDVALAASLARTLGLDASIAPAFREMLLSKPELTDKLDAIRWNIVL